MLLLRGVNVLGWMSAILCKGTLSSTLLLTDEVSPRATVQRPVITRVITNLGWGHERFRVGATLLIATPLLHACMHAEGGSNGRVEDRSQLLKLC